MKTNISSSQSIEAQSNAALQAQSSKPISDPLIYLDDLRLVGTTKLMGYLPLNTIIDICQSDPQSLMAQAAHRGLSARKFTQEECNIASGALYIFAAEKLGEFLSAPRNAKVLRRHRWPAEAHRFVRKVATDFAQAGELYDLVALCFNDPRPKYHDRWREVACEKKTELY